MARLSKKAIDKRRNMLRKLNQYELYTTKTLPNDMPFPVFAKNRESAIRFIKRKLRKGERIVSLKRAYKVI